MSVRDEVADKLRHLALDHPAERIWGRAKNLPVHDAERYAGVESGKRQTRFDPYSLGPEGNVWAGSPEDVAEVLDKARLLMPQGVVTVGREWVVRPPSQDDPIHLFANGPEQARRLAKAHDGVVLYRIVTTVTGEWEQQ